MCRYFHTLHCHHYLHFNRTSGTQTWCSLSPSVNSHNYSKTHGYYSSSWSGLGIRPTNVGFFWYQAERSDNDNHHIFGWYWNWTGAEAWYWCIHCCSISLFDDNYHHHSFYPEDNRVQRSWRSKCHWNWSWRSREGQVSECDGCSARSRVLILWVGKLSNLGKPFMLHLNVLQDQRGLLLIYSFRGLTVAAKDCICIEYSL